MKGNERKLKGKETEKDKEVEMARGKRRERKGPGEEINMARSGNKGEERTREERQGNQMKGETGKACKGEGMK